MDKRQTKNPKQKTLTLRSPWSPQPRRRRWAK